MLEGDDSAGRVEFPHAEEARVEELLDFGPVRVAIVQPVRSVKA
jgi:hypothetical protein